MIAAAVNHIQTAAAAGAQVGCLQDLFYGPDFCQVQYADYYSYTEAIPDGPTTRLLQVVERQHGIVIVAPMYEEEHPGIYYNTAAVIDADGSYLGKYRKTHIPQVKGFWEKFYFRPGNTGYPIFDTAAGRIGVYICYDRHFPEGWRALGLAGARIVFNPSATSRGLSQYLWRLEQPAAAVANEYFVGAINRGGVQPGGIDVHTHMEMPFGGTFSADTFETGTRAAAWGGTTTIIDFAVQPKATSPLATMDKWHAKADGNCSIDYGFHMIVSDVNDQTLKEMDACIDAGVNSFKMFMAYPGVFYATDGEILLAMQQASRSGATVMMHAENGIAIDQLVAQAIASGRTDPVEHGLTRPPELEGEATSRAITLAGVADCPLYIVHLSARQALEAVAAARDAGQNVFAETCPQYLWLSIDDLARPDFEEAKFVASPPLRTRHHQDTLWKGLRTNDLSVVSTDHCPFCFKDQKELGRGDFSKIPNGMPGVEHRMDLLHAGVAAGHLSLTRWVEVASTTPALMFGLYPRKGVIAAGSDADIVVYDPRARQTLSAATHHMNVDYSAYEGMEITGQVVTTLSRGRVVIGDGTYQGSPGHGAFLSRGLNEYPA